VGIAHQIEKQDNAGWALPTKSKNKTTQGGHCPPNQNEDVKWMLPTKNEKRNLLNGWSFTEGSKNG